MKILIVDDDASLRNNLRRSLEKSGHQVVEAQDGLEAVQIVKDVPDLNVAILDVNMPRMNGLDALTRIREINSSIFCIVATACGQIKDAVTAIKNGAYDYLEKPVDVDRMMRLLQDAKYSGELAESAAFSAPFLKFDEGRTIVGGSTSIKKVFDVIGKLARVDTSVLIRGESGTGKELVARALHYNSSRRTGPFVAVNCAAIPENLIESELFGFEKGAFTGADKRKFGKFQAADGGTIFLDEIGDISQQMQVKLLRVIQERSVVMVGSNQEISVDVRIVAATNRHLEKMIEQGTFREDLYYRLNILPIMLPPLRDRRDDVPALAEFMIRKFNRVHKRSITGLTSEARRYLQNYTWPGNIRELENVIERAFILESTNEITLASLPDHILAVLDDAGPRQEENEESKALPSYTETGVLPDFDTVKENFEREFLVRALKKCNGRINLTAETINMNKVTLLRKLEKLKIDPKEFYPHS